MQRFAAFLRGVTPMNLKMSDLKRSFEAAGFSEVKTLLSSGNVVFTARPDKALERKAEAVMQKELGRTFMTIVRPLEALDAIVAADPYRKFGVPPVAKRVVTFLREKPARAPKLPIELHGASILQIDGVEVFSAYVPTPHGPVFMNLIEKTFGKHVTTRTWDTVKKVAALKGAKP
jgi:uncharacterized protein (DUF1697 family)